MKNKIQLSVLKNVVLITFISLAFLSCGKDDEPVVQTTTYAELPSNLIGTFTGSLSYSNSDGSVTVANPNGTATISSLGSKTYKVSFSDNVPEISSLKFTTGTSGSYSSAAQDGSTAGLVLNTNSMDLSVSSGGKTWSFSGSK